MRPVSSSPEHRGRDQQRRHARHRGQGRNAALRRHRHPQVGTHHESHVTCHECHVSRVTSVMCHVLHVSGRPSRGAARTGRTSGCATTATASCPTLLTTAGRWGYLQGGPKKVCSQKTKIGHTFFWSTLYISTLYLHIYVKSTYLLSRWRPTRGTA